MIFLFCFCQDFWQTCVLRNGCQNLKFTVSIQILHGIENCIEKILIIREIQKLKLLKEIQRLFSGVPLKLSLSWLIRKILFIFKIDARISFVKFLKIILALLVDLNWILQVKYNNFHDYYRSKDIKQLRFHHSHRNETSFSCHCFHEIKLTANNSYNWYIWEMCWPIFLL